MDLRKITDDFSVSPQISPEDVPAIAGAGFRSILCNRPDDEEPGQSPYDDIANAARNEGLEVRMVPIVSGRAGPEDVRAFDDALRDLSKPVLAYCRSGTRCTMLWSIVQMGRMDAEEIVSRTAAAGYDMSGLVSRLKQD